MYQDSLKDQAEKLLIPGFVPENESKLQKMPIQGGINPKKLRKMQELQSTEDKQRELLRLKKELEEKERIEKRLRDLEEEALGKEAAYKAKYQNAELRRQEQMEAKQAKAIRAQKPYPAQANGSRSSSVPAERKHFAGLAAVQEKEEEKKE